MNMRNPENLGLIEITITNVCKRIKKWTKFVFFCIH